jgi:hypothetical protein
MSGVDKTRQGKSSQDPDLAGLISSPSLPPDRARSEDRAEIWSASEWKQRFEVEWLEKYGGLAMGGGMSAAKATGDLADQLAALPAPDRLAAQARSVLMIAEFLGDARLEITRARHPWAWFVARFDSLRVPAVPVKPPPPPSPRAPSGFAYPELGR